MKIKACVPDKIPFLLKNCAEAIAIFLTLIIIASLTNSQLPVQFRSASETPLFQKGDNTLASNYRPVSLTSIPCKVMENIIRAKLEEYLYENNLLTKK